MKIFGELYRHNYCIIHTLVQCIFTWSGKKNLDFVPLFLMCPRRMILLFFFECFLMQHVCYLSSNILLSP